MTFIEFLNSKGIIDKAQLSEIDKMTKTNKIKPGQLILQKNYLQKSDLIEQLQNFVEINNSLK